MDGFADALIRAIEMPRYARTARMRAMRRAVAGRNVFSWASDVLEGLESLWSKPLHYITPRRGGCTCLMRRNAAERMILSRRHVPVLAHFAGSNVLVAFDYDGTLAPIVATLRPRACGHRPGIC